MGRGRSSVRSSPSTLGASTCPRGFWRSASSASSWRGRLALMRSRKKTLTLCWKRSARPRSCRQRSSTNWRSSGVVSLGAIRLSHHPASHKWPLNLYNSFILLCLEYCCPVWSSATDSHFKLLDKNLRARKCLLPILTISL